MKKLLFTMAVIFLYQIAPLLGAPALLLHWKMLTIIAVAAILWLSQPAVRAGEAAANRARDRHTLWLILAMAGVSTVLPEVEWAYGAGSKDGLPFWNALALAVIGSGVGFRIWAIRTLGRYFTATVQTAAAQPLMTTGPYAVVRHPSYLGAYAAIVGCALLLQAWLGLGVAVAGMFYAYDQRIKAEEAALTACFGDAYRRYALKTKRMLPGIW